MSKILDQITNEVHQYLFETAEISDGVSFSEYKLKKRINFFKNRHYPTGKVTEEGDIEYWFDIIHPRVNDEVKNLRLDSKYFTVFSKNPIGDFPAVYIANCKLSEWMEENGKADELSEATEDFSADGNLLLERTSNGYERWDMLNTFLTNTTARTVNETAIIKRFYMTQSDLRKKKGVYDNVDEVIRDCGNKFFTKTELGVVEQSQTPLYELYCRTGEVSEEVLFDAQKLNKKGDPDKYILARIVVCGIKKGKTTERYVLFAEALPAGDRMSDWFKEAHRGPYKGRWFREGLYELLFDQQTAYNDITIEIMRAVPWNTRAFFRHTDVRTLNNIRTALKNGSLIKSADLQQIQVSARVSEALATRNAILEDANSIANSFEVIQGKSVPSGMPFRLGALLDVNASKLYEHLRKKLAVPYRHVYKEFLLERFIKDIKGKDIIRLTGDAQFIERYRRLVAESWFNKNLPIIGPYTPETREALIKEKMIELQKIDPVLKNNKEIWKEVLPRLYVTIVGENFNVEEQETIGTMLQFETDPIRRAFLLDYIYALKGIPIPPGVQALVPQVSGGAAAASSQLPGGGDGGEDGAPVETEAEPAPAQV